MADSLLETPKERILLAQDAGLSRVSFLSTIAGVVVAYATFAILAAIAGGIVGATGVDGNTLSADEWNTAGIAGAVALALSAFLAYLFGGYCAGRMARRSGLLHGLLVFVTSVVIAAAAALIGATQTSESAVLSELESFGVPTSSADLQLIGTVAGIATVVLMLAGALLGGWMGDRWHGKLLRRALDPTIGVEADERLRVEEREAAVMQRHEEARERVATAQAADRDTVVDLRDDREPAERDERPRAGVIGRNTQAD